ncbi:hypothetical protein WR25_17927 [Diploscapter pachys]|uniref:Phlebovirus glycoprotein G2 fusion domain-containing protein n=1 Tax=Diploscapter pachys TaxID=2018661 RepID=A0A2A2KEB9_9BILA|nr:hypothetical protein WR25_17927 [Diploscapter pachys]
MGLPLQAVLILILFLLCPAVSRVIDELPHCTNSRVMEGNIRDCDDSKGKCKVFSAIQIRLGLHESACLQLKTNSSEPAFIHTLEYLRLEHHHPIAGKYSFGIPQIKPSCICDCAGGDVTCTLKEYSHGNCTHASICYRTHSFVSNEGCLTQGQAEACCDIAIEPYKGWRFTAIKINQPDTWLIFRYSIFSRSAQTWRQISSEIIKVPLNNGIARFQFNQIHHIELSVSGGPTNRRVEPGMYFVREGSHELHGGTLTPLNDLTETHMERLGWMRFNDEGKLAIYNGDTKIKIAHSVRVINCVKQEYETKFAGREYVLDTGKRVTENFDLGKALTEESWIKTARVESRVVVVEHGEGSYVNIDVLTETRPQILKHPSQMQNFSGLIQLDRESNRFLNVTFFGVKGTLIGKIYKSETKTEPEMTFSVQTSLSKTLDQLSIISVPASINGKRYVCFYPASDLKGEICKWFNYDSQPLHSYKALNPFEMQVGDCHGCNARGLEGYLVSLDPRSWLNGLNSPYEWLAFIAEVVLGIGLILLIVALCTKCIIPLACCSLRIPKYSRKNRKK